MIFPGREKFLELSEQYNLIPVFKEWLVDLDTPISVYKKISPSGPSYLLESVEGGENLARYSFIGVDPFLTYYSWGSKGLCKGVNGVLQEVRGSPLKVLEKLLKQYRVPYFEQLPRFYGGAVGYFSYDLIRFLENLPSLAIDDLGLPDCAFTFAGMVLVFDHVQHRLKVIVNSLVGNDPLNSYNCAIDKMEILAACLRGKMTNAAGGENYQNGKFEKRESIGNDFNQVLSDPKPNMTREQFEKKVLKIKEYIRAGDILQAVISQRFKLNFRGDPLRAYRRLRAINPSPYMYYLNFGNPVIVGSSPEMLIRVTGGQVETCPIAGTRPRGKNQASDQILAEELLADPKERAEHLMLVDLGRNDLGRVCIPGSVELSQFMAVERYSHVMHLVSHVQGKLISGKSSFDALAACFPAGTVSGAPKIRAMEIIEELEPTRRGVYAGAVGYFGFNGNMDTAITIRTIVINNGYAYVQAGAGIVADSEPEREYEETINKARALIKTLEQGGDGYDPYD